MIGRLGTVNARNEINPFYAETTFVLGEKPQAFLKIK